MKVCLLGDGAVGKTALRERYLGKQFCKSLCFIDNLDVVEFDKFLVCIDLEGVSSLEKIWESRKYSSDVMCYVGFKSIKEEITFWIFLFS